MLFNITGKRIDITEAIKGHAEEKTAKFTRYYDSINRAEVIIDGSKGGSISVEIIASAEHNKVFVVKEVGGDVYGCFDAAVRKLERQLRRTKSKERDNKRTGGGELV